MKNRGSSSQPKFPKIPYVSAPTVSAPTYTNVASGFAAVNPYSGYSSYVMNYIMNGSVGTTPAEFYAVPEPPISAALRDAILRLRVRHAPDELRIAELTHPGQTARPSPITAYRAWDARNGRLCSVGVGPVAWPTRRLMEAVCQGGGSTTVAHDAPHRDCTCGVYGFATPGALEQVMAHGVLGRVCLGGAVVVCTEDDEILGFRAQSAYPSLLFLWDAAGSSVASKRNDEIRALAAAYGVEVAPLPDALVERLEERKRAERTAAAGITGYYPIAPPAFPGKGSATITGSSWGTTPLSTQSAYAAQSGVLNGLMNSTYQQALNAYYSAQVGAAPSAPSTTPLVDPMSTLNATEVETAKALGIRIATPSTVTLHDRLRAVAERLFKGKEKR